MTRPSKTSSPYSTFAYAPVDGASRQHPYARASWLSRVFLGWASPLMALGNTKQLDFEDTWPLQPAHQASTVTVEFGRDFARTNSLARAFLASFGWRFAFTGVGLLIATASTLAGPLVLQHVVTQLSSGEYDVKNLALWIIGLLGTQLVQALADNYANFDSEVIAIQFTGALKNLIYRKALRLNAESRKEKSTGDISNMYTTDCQMIAMCGFFVHQLWIVPLQITVASVLLYRLLGAAFFAGLGVIFATFIISNFVSFRVFSYYKELMKRKDDRMAVVTEAFKTIAMVKFNAWEDQFIKRIAESRAIEVKAVWGLMRFNAVGAVFSWGLPVFISVAAFGVYAGVLGHQLTPAIVFTSLALFELIQDPIQMMTAIIAACVMAIVGAGRINELLALPELETDNVLTVNHPQADKYIANNVIVAIDNATLAWSANDEPTLKNVNLQIHNGDFVVVHGPVGCGKSSLCSALLGDMTKTQGQVYVGGSVAYCAQQPWIQHATVRDNILFGHPFDRKKYDRVLEACALTQDLKSLPAGDRTEIGERGVNLSGGQKARVALARACYSDASVFILDAPLSAVDAIVQNEIFQKCLLGLLRHRTIILVTHNPEIIVSEHVTRAVTINEDGSLSETRVLQGERPSHSPVLTPLAARAYSKSNMMTFEDEPQGESSLLRGSHAHELAEVMDLVESNRGAKSPLHKLATAVTYDEDGEQKLMKRSGSAVGAEDESHRLVDDEERKVGRVGAHVFAAYYYAVGGFPVLLLVLVSQVLWQGLQIASDFWLKDWSTDVVSPQNTEEVAAEYHRLKIYALLGLTSAAMVVVRTMTTSYFGLRAARRMFDRMTEALMHAPMKFYDANPIGRVLMRYSNDTTDVDIQIPQTLGSFIANLFSIGCTVATIVYIIGWYGVFLLPIVVIYSQVGDFYLQPAREVERLNRTTEAPILTHLSESVEGGSTIRAFGSTQVGRFHVTNEAKIDDANRAWYARLAVSRWFTFRIQLLGAMVNFVVAFSLVILHDTLSAAVIGLAFSYVLKVAGAMERIVQRWSTVETSMVSPERLQQYTDVEQEAPHTNPVFDPSPTTHWPQHGAITFQHVDFRYKDTDKLVLHDLNFTINSGEKIGIVGRTGAGKSSLTMALFRINELAGGSVTIDGVDVGQIGLKTLRSKLSIIPQNPVLFKGALRKNIDPFDEFSDDAIWDAIRRVGLTDRIASEESKLEYVVEENGENFSVGERQMLCMSRALLRESRIVIFDEATAAIDHETDQKLQRVIRDAFGKSTVLTIAHRLDTILDSDRILVLDGGHVAEFASPSALVGKGSGHFFELMQEGGYLDKFRKSQE